MKFELTEKLIGGAAIDEFGTPLPEDTLATCQQSDAVLLAAIGGYVHQSPFATQSMLRICTT